MGTGNSQKITLRHRGNLTARGNGREEVVRRHTQPWYSITQGWRTAPAAPCPNILPSLVQSRDQELGWLSSPWQLSCPIPSFSHPSPGCSARKAVPGEAAALCKVLSPCLCPPGTGLLSPSVQWGGQGQTRALGGEKLWNVTWSVALPGLSCMADCCSEQSQEPKHRGCCSNVSSVPDWKHKSQSGAGERLLNSNWVACFRKRLDTGERPRSWKRSDSQGRKTLHNNWGIFSFAEILFALKLAAI